MDKVRFGKLRMKMLEHSTTLSNFSLAIGCERAKLSRCLNGSQPFSYQLIRDISNELGLDKSEIGSYFF